MDDIMAEPAEKPTTVDEFLRWDDGTDTRYELIDGRIFAMAPPSRLHDAVVMNVAAFSTGECETAPPATP